MLCAGLSLSITNAVDGLALVDFIMIVRCPLAVAIRKLWKNITYRTWKLHSPAGATQ